MDFLKDAPLQTKITWVTMLTTLATLLFAVASISILEVSEFRQSFLRELRSIAGVTGGNSVAALQFLDVSAAQKTLAVLREDPRIIEAALYDDQGDKFATFLADMNTVSLPDKVALREGESQSQGVITVEVPIYHKSQAVGAILLKATAKQVVAQLIEYASITLVISLGSCIAAYLLSQRMRALISDPIIRLSNTAREVSKSGNYSLRVQKESNDETGVLVDKFNEMLSQIEATTIKLQASEHQLRLITDSLPVLISYVDASERFQFTNAPYEKLLMLSALELRGKNMEHAVGKRAYSSFRPHLGKVLRGDSVQFEAKIPFPLVGERYMNAHFIPDIENDLVRGFFAVMVDITERKQAEAEREQLLESERMARSEAERASKLKDEFLTTLSHELRTPLNAIVGWSQLLARGQRSQDQISEGLSVIARNARVQTQLIEDLLDLSRIVSGKLLLDKKPLDMSLVVSAAIDAVALSAQAKEISIESHVDEQALMVSGDFSRLQQVVWNLLVNSVKFTPNGGKIDVYLRSPERDFVEVLVKDSGQGIAAEFLPYVFERFRQGDSSTTRKHGGLGIGLSLVKQLVELHGGSVQVESPGVGLGTTIAVRLPVGIQRGAEDQSKEVTQPETYALEGVKVLVIDDEPDACSLVTQMLEDHKIKVISSGNAKSGFDLFRSQRPNLIITDIGMPEHDGYDFIRWVRSLSADEGGATPVVAVTAFAHEDDRRRALLAGFQFHIAKPVDQSQLLSVVSSLSKIQNSSGASNGADSRVA